MRRIFGTATFTSTALALALTACTHQSAATPVATLTPTASASTPTPTPTSATPTPTTTSPSPSPSTSSATPTAPPARTVQDVDWKNARLPIMCGGPVELVQLTKGAGKSTDGLVVEFLDVTFGSVTSDPVDNIAVVQLDCIGAHPGPVDAPVFRSGSAGPEFLGFATMSLDKFRSAAISKGGIVIHGIGSSDTAAGCCPDLATTMISSVRGDAVAFQERDTAPLSKSHKPGTECDVLDQIDAQSAELAKQTKGHAPTHTAVVLAKLTTAVAAERAEDLLTVLRSQLQRGCP
ncbi:MAG: hypothetical protein QOK14_1776 [Frankiaceae bacterium]|nr:hypothetical protein [Frankiaceae bacterium]